MVDGNYNRTWLELFLQRKGQLLRKITYTALLGLSLYVISPTVVNYLLSVLGLEKGSKGPKRLDKFTTGLVNPGNDCFINSSIQALVPLDKLTTYLSATLEDEKTASTLPLHNGLATMLLELQQLRSDPKSVSSKRFIQQLETIFGGKISRQQNDAHEFTQLILERLNEENLTLDHADLTVPFKGIVGNHLVCLQCGRTSHVNEQPFYIYELTLPQQGSVKLSDLVNGEQMETIENYSCMYCKTVAMLTNEREEKSNVSRTDAELNILKFLKGKLSTLLINEELPEHITHYINSYNKGYCNTSEIKSVIVRKSTFAEFPEIFLIHLSRSVFNGMNYSRNPCQVEFEEEILLPRQILKDHQCVGFETVKYKLKSIVKHTGSHYQGHYQCYRHKPTLLLEKVTGNIINGSPIITLNTLQSTVSTTSCSLENEERFQNLKEDKKKLKLLKSVKMNPYWWISDSSVKECKVSRVLDEKKYVYMLYYERIH